MNYYKYRPALPLAAFVEQFWLYEGYRQDHTRERVMPRGNVELIINLQTDRFNIYDRNNPELFSSLKGSLAVGPHSESFIIDTTSQSTIMGLVFKPGGAFPFFDMPIHELRDRHISLDDLWGNTAQGLRERLLEAPTPAAKFQTFEKILLGKLVRPLELRPAVRYALGKFKSSPPVATVADMAEQTGFSSRRFLQIFNEEVGLTPKLYWRVQRFQEILRHLQQGESLNWSDLYLSLGYFDQAHFNHDFFAFSGLNPGAYLAQRSIYQNHVRLPE